MGWTDDEVEGHEGYAAYLTRDGRTAGSSSGLGVLIRRLDAGQAAAAAWRQNRTPTNEDMYDLVPYADVVGWRNLCECGWQGTTWDRAATTVTGSFPDADSAYLPGGDSVDDAAYAEWQTHIQPLKRLAGVQAAAAAYAAARDELDRAVHAARASDPAASWADIGRATGMTRQSAHERWSEASADI